MSRIREGGRMDTTGVMVMGVFLGLCVLGLVWGLRQARQQREQAWEFAAARGWQYTKYDPELGKRLESMNPATDWTATNVMHSGNLWLFSSQTRPRRGRSSSSFGMTCLVEHTAPQITATVGVDRRVPALEKLQSERVPELGSEEFRKGWVVSCSDAEVARRVVTEGVQRALVDHDAGPAYLLSLVITPNGIVVDTTWAKMPEEWDYLVRLTKRLSEAY